MKNLRITSGVQIAGTHYADGDIVEGVDTSIAAEIVAAGRAVVINIEPAAIVIPDPIVKTRDPLPKADRKSKAVDAPADA